MKVATLSFTRQSFRESLPSRQPADYQLVGSMCDPFEDKVAEEAVKHEDEGSEGSEEK